MDFKAYVPERRTTKKIHHHHDGKEESSSLLTANSATVVNICNHAYWNLGDYSSSRHNSSTNDVMENHHLHIPHGNFYLSLDKLSIPTGEILSTKNTPLDFVSNGGKLLSQNMMEGGYDHCIVLNSSSAPIGKLRHAATLTYVNNNSSSSSSSSSTTTTPKNNEEDKRQMKVYTTLPGVQVYSGNFLKDGTVGHSENVKFGRRSGVCLETQLFPDSPNYPNHFPSCVVKPGETWKHVTVHCFSY